MFSLAVSGHVHHDEYDTPCEVTIVSGDNMQIHGGNYLEAGIATGVLKDFICTFLIPSTA